MLSAQVDNGGGLPWLSSTTRRARGYPTISLMYRQQVIRHTVPTTLWLFSPCTNIMAETGDKAFLDEVIPYANRDEGTVYDHLKRAINFSMERPVPTRCRRPACRLERLPASRKGRITVALQLYYAMSVTVILPLTKTIPSISNILTRFRPSLGYNQ